MKYWLGFILVLGQFAFAASIPQLGGRRVPIDFEVAFLSHDNANVFLFTKEKSQRLFVVDLSKWGRERLVGPADLPIPGPDAEVLKNGVSGGWLYIAMVWMERDGFPIQIFGKPVNQLMDKSATWQKVGTPLKLHFRPQNDVQIEFDPYFPVVYSAGTMGLISGLQRLDLQTGQWQLVTTSEAGGTYHLSEQFIIIAKPFRSSSLSDTTDVVVLDKKTLALVSSKRLAGHNQGFVADREKLYQIRAVDSSLREMVTYSLPMLSQEQVVPLPWSNRVSLDRLIKVRLLIVTGGVSYNPAKFEAKLFSPQDGSTCVLGQFRGNGELRNIEFIDGAHPLLIATEEYDHWPPTRQHDFVIADLILDICQ